MISRIAESCFYLTRDFEKIISTSQLLLKTRDFVLDTNLDKEIWKEVTKVLGCETEKDAIRFFVWNKKNEGSIFNLVNNIRFNALVIRTHISRDVWEAINSFYLWINSKKALKKFNSDSNEFFSKVLQNCFSFYGLFYKTVLRDNTYWFMVLGEKLEKSIQTLNKVSLLKMNLDNKVLKTMQWIYILESCNSSEHFMQSYSDVSEKNVMNFLLLDRVSSNSICFNLRGIQKGIEYITSKETKTNEVIKECLGKLNSKNTELSFIDSLRKDVEHIFNSINEQFFLSKNEIYNQEIS